MSQQTAPAIFFHADAVESKGKDIVGRRSAGQSFLKGFLEHAGRRDPDQDGSQSF